MRTSILFVCLGNICRSPLAEGVMRHLARERGVEDRYRIDSAGTGAWHAGERADGRSVEVARRNGVELDGRARQVEPQDFEEFDWIVAMDRSNLDRLESMKREAGGGPRLALLRDFDPDPGDREVPDPYYGGPGGFDDVWEMVRRSADGFLDRLEAEAAEAEEAKAEKTKAEKTKGGEAKGKEMEAEKAKGGKAKGDVGERHRDRG